jgi:hypothetical protein
MRGARKIRRSLLQNDMMSLGSRAWMMRRRKKMRGARYSFAPPTQIRCALPMARLFGTPADGMDRASSGQPTQERHAGYGSSQSRYGSHPNTYSKAPAEPPANERSQLPYFFPSKMNFHAH